MTGRKVHLRIAQSDYIRNVAHARGRVGPPPRLRPARPSRPRGLIPYAVLFGVVAIIGVAFLANGLQFTGRVIRTTATVVAVRQVTDAHLAHTRHTEFTLRFTAQDHQVVTVQTDQVMQAQPAAPGDRIQVYVPADPAEVTDVRFGPPGSYDFYMAAAFFGLAVPGSAGTAIAWVRKKRPRSFLPPAACESADPPADAA